MQITNFILPKLTKKRRFWFVLFFFLYFHVLSWENNKNSLFYKNLILCASTYLYFVLTWSKIFVVCFSKSRTGKVIYLATFHWCWLSSWVLQKRQQSTPMKWGQINFYLFYLYVLHKFVVKVYLLQFICRFQYVGIFLKMGRWRLRLPPVSMVTMQIKVIGTLWNFYR